MKTSSKMDTNSKFTKFFAEEDLSAKDTGIVRLFCRLSSYVLHIVVYVTAM
jgi:hypothetical protein